MAETYPSDNSLLNLIGDSETGIEYIETGKAPYYLEFRKLLYRLLLATKRANDLRAFNEGGLNIGVKAGKYWDGNTLRNYPGSTTNSLADDKTNIYVYLNNSGTLILNEYSAWPDVSINHLRLAVVTTSAGSITNIIDARDHHILNSFKPAIADSTIAEAMLGSSTASGVTVGAVACKRIDSATLEALLDTSTNNLFAVNTDDLILKVVFCTKTAAGAACTVDIGIDATAGDGDADGFVVDADANAAGIYSSENASYDGVHTHAGGYAAAADGYITITSSTDQSASSFVGGAYMLYVPA